LWAQGPEENIPALQHIGRKKERVSGFFFLGGGKEKNNEKRKRKKKKIEREDREKMGSI
jgi:hypothetical protein